jgi:catechol 2,3-dioxygenase-like lactoylglutathione lyase family enzyme
VPSTIDTVTFDAHDPQRVADFWCEALGYRVSAVHEGWGIEVRHPDEGPTVPLLFLIVPEDKTVKNRVHLDIRPPASKRDEADRLVGAGATVVREDEGWIVLRDPEGNEFCVLDGPVDEAAKGEADGSSGG